MVLFLFSWHVTSIRYFLFLHNLSTLFLTFYYPPFNVKAQLHENHKQPSKKSSSYKKEKLNFHIWRNFCKIGRDDTARELCWFAFVPPIQLRNWNRRLHRQRSAFSFSSSLVSRRIYECKQKGIGNQTQARPSRTGTKRDGQQYKRKREPTSGWEKTSFVWKTNTLAVRFRGVRRSIRTFDNFSVNIDRQASIVKYGKTQLCSTLTLDDVAPTSRLKCSDHPLTMRVIARYQLMINPRLWLSA